MAAQISPQQLSRAVCNTIKDGTYPEDEVVISAELTSPALESLAQLLTQAREEVKTSIRELSRINADEVDGWIAEAKQLRKDLDDSQKQTSDIGKLAAQRRELENIATDANHKVEFLKRELVFNGRLTDTLERTLAVRNIIDGAQEAVLSKNIKEATDLLCEAEKQLLSLEGCQRTSMLNLLRAKIIDIRDNTAKIALAAWHRLMVPDYEQGLITIKLRFEADPRNSIEKVVFVLHALDLLKGRMIQLKNDAQNIIFQPIVGKASSRKKRSIKITGPVIEAVEDDADPSVEKMLSNVSAAFNYFSLILPGEMVPQLFSILSPSVVGQMIAGPLAASVPPDLSGISTFAENLTRVQTFAETMNARKWPGAAKLQEWVQDAPIVWLHHRTNSSLSSVRLLLARGLGKPRAVERVETQVVQVEDDVFQEPGSGEPDEHGEPGDEKGEGDEPDDWNASWVEEDEEDASKTTKPMSPKKTAATAGGDDDDDEDGADDWGWGDEDEATDDNPLAAPAAAASVAADEDDGADDWGWGDEDQLSPVKIAPSPKKAAPSPKKAAAPSPKKSKPAPSPKKVAAAAPQPTSKEITLRETYHITSIPSQIIEIVVSAVDDASQLSQSQSDFTVIQAASHGLYSLPELILSMFRACAPNFYGKDPSGNMYLYNDCLYLVEQLEAFASHYKSNGSNGTGAGNDNANPQASKPNTNSSPTTPHLDLAPDILALSTFGKSAYGREMDLQRTIVRDLLEGAQGFAHCTQPPFRDACEAAVSSAIDRLQQLAAQWQHVLSPSALQQSLGSLLGSVTGKMLADVQDLEDVAEPESRRLVEFCQRVEQLELLFLPPEERAAVGVDEEEQMAARAAMAASIYTPGLLKFQWLSQILEGTLADIRYWWGESELALAFSPEEMVDLVQALFADSEHRRKTISAIRSASKG